MASVMIAEAFSAEDECFSRKVPCSQHYLVFPEGTLTSAGAAAHLCLNCLLSPPCCDSCELRVFEDPPGGGKTQSGRGINIPPVVIAGVAGTAVESSHS